MLNQQPGSIDILDAPIISFLQFFIKPAHQRPFESFLLRLLVEAREFPGCLWAYAYKAEDLTLQYIALSGWDTAQHIQEFEEVPRHVRAARMGEEEFFIQPVIMRRYQRFEVEGWRGPSAR